MSSSSDSRDVSLYVISPTGLLTAVKVSPPWKLRCFGQPAVISQSAMIFCWLQNNHFLLRRNKPPLFPSMLLKLFRAAYFDAQMSYVYELFFLSLAELWLPTFLKQYITSFRSHLLANRHMCFVQQRTKLSRIHLSRYSFTEERTKNSWLGLAVQWKSSIHSMHTSHKSVLPFSDPRHPAASRQFPSSRTQDCVRCAQSLSLSGQMEEAISCLINPSSGTNTSWGRGIANNIPRSTPGCITFVTFRYPRLHNVCLPDIRIFFETKRSIYSESLWTSWTHGAAGCRNIRRRVETWNGLLPAWICSQKHHTIYLRAI